jgi:NAD(P)H-flavin reductase
MLLCLALLVMLSYNREWLRKPYYEIWLVLHISAAGAFVAYAGKHRVGTWFVVVVIWWAIDGLWRYGQGTIWRWPKTATLSVLTLADYNDDDNPVVHNNNDSTKVVVVELSFTKKALQYSAGQYVRVAVLETGQPIMFHPLTISSAPYEQSITVHFRPSSSGGWTRQVSKLVGRNDDQGKFCSVVQKRNEGPLSSQAIHNNNNSRTTVHVLLEGPYGGLSMNLWDDDPYRYPVVILIAGGIGVTPIRSITRQLLHEQQHDHAGIGSRRIIRVVWAVRDVALVEALPLLDGCHRPDDNGPDDESGEALASTTTTTRPLPNDTVCDGLVWGNNDPAMDDNNVHHHRGNKNDVPKTTAHFAASIYVTGPKNQDDDGERVSNGLEDRAPFRSRNGHRRKHRRNGDDGVDEIELGQVVGSRHDDGQTRSKSPMIHKSPPSTSTCHNHGDDRISFFTGRPDIRVIMETTLSSTTFHSDQRVAVIVCGPPAMVQDAKMVCANLHGRPVPLDFHEEVFEW